MSDNQNFGFGKFVPGFDFLQNIAKGASQTLPQMPNLSNWVAPTLNLEELEKRIDELKAVHFWLDQNSKALSATIQALEVQKMTLATLKGMNFNMGDVANALKLKAADTVFTGVQKVSERAADTARTISGAAAGAASKSKAARKAGKGAAPAGVVDPLQWWGALTQQFQQIAAGAMKDAATQTAVSTAKNMATGVAREAMKTATGMAKAATAGSARKAPARRAAKKAR
ncbi:MAG: PhaM family polyhydroxyalkanoate granule multifunctional regulatory protein [Ramlibacter sp.]|nr:PhaM family polyhydroxyalkanoate granule multifunctional regulatory protein [Ramlibacter sp.]